jgi:hypothetical protein
MANLQITSNFVGDHAGNYISAALKSAKTLDYLTVLENVKYKRNISTVTSSSLIQNASCDFTDLGELSMTEKIITPKNLAINIDLCKNELLEDWQSLQMQAGAHNSGMSNDFAAYVMSYLAETIANGTETSCWTGVHATAGQFEGFLTGTTGMYAVDAPTTSSASGAYTAVNIVANLGQLVADIPPNIYAKSSEDLYIFMNPKTYRFYISAISTLGYNNLYSMNETYVPTFEGIKIAVCAGVSDNVMVAAEKGNQFFATDLLSDATQISMLDGAAWGSDNLRVVVNYSGGVQTGIASDITYQS